MLAEFTTVHDFANNFIAAHGGDAQLDESIGEKNASAAMNFFWESTEGCGNSGNIAGPIAGGNCEALAGLKHDAHAAGKCAGANFRAAKIGENGQRLLHYGRGLAKQSDHARVPLVRAVRKIQAGHVHTRTHELRDHTPGIRGGPQSANNF